MNNAFASTVLTVLLYAQGLLGFAGLTTIVLKDYVAREPVFVVGVDSTITSATR